MEYQKRRELFLSPPVKYRGKPFWAWNGKLDKTELLKQIDTLKQMGFGGYFMHSRTGLKTEYLGDEWFELINRCADYGSDINMESWLYDEDRWPSGTAGGLVTKDKNCRAMLLEMKQYTKDTYDKRIWEEPFVIAFACHLESITYTEERVLQKDDLLKDGETAVVFRILYTECNNFYNGYTYLDTMNKNAVSRFIEVTHEAYKEKCESRIGTKIKGIFTDEPHRGALFSTFSDGKENAVPYTPQLFQEFEKKFGYDLVPHLLELFLVKDANKISRVTRDYIELCQELFIENYAKPIQNWCHRNHMVFTGHVLHEDTLFAQTVMQGSLMRFYEYMDYPGVDVLTQYNKAYWIVKQVVSVARQLDKKWILSELYGGTGWQMSFEAYKYTGIWQTFFGVNLRCPHLSWYTMKGEAKRDYPASILNQSAWFSEFKYLEDYFSRIHAALSDGKPDCELLVISPIESVWARAYSTAFDGLEARDEDIRRIQRQYEEVFHSLTQSRIDFDYGDEDIMSRHSHLENGYFFVGQSSYRKVLVAGMETMRSSTLTLLKKFQKQGGEVIFAGEVPEYVDALPSGEVTEFSKEALKIPLNFEAISKYCRSGNEITVEGEADRDILARVTFFGEDRIVMLLNINREIAYHNVMICMGEGKYVELWDARTGQVYQPKQYKKNERIYINENFAEGEGKLYVITKVKHDLPVRKLIGQKEKINVPEAFRYKLSEMNICVLDKVRVVTDKGETINYREVLKADRSVRDLIGIPYRGGDMVQPWYQLKYGSNDDDQPLRKLYLEYQFEIDTIPEDIMLAVEDMEHIRGIMINGKTIQQKSTGKWIDLCFDKIIIPVELLKIGTNEITIKYDYFKTEGIEAIYLLGNFGVGFMDEGQKPVLTRLPELLKAGDITKQGLPFYSGKVSYFIDNLDQIQLRVKLENFAGACVKLKGEEEAFIAWPPYCTDIKGLTEIQLTLTRRNTFGPLHQMPARAFAYGPENFITEGKEWTDQYVLIPQGLLKAPQIWKVQ